MAPSCHRQDRPRSASSHSFGYKVLHQSTEGESTLLPCRESSASSCPAGTQNKHLSFPVMPNIILYQQIVFGSNYTVNSSAYLGIIDIFRNLLIIVCHQAHWNIFLLK